MNGLKGNGASLGMAASKAGVLGRSAAVFSRRVFIVATFGCLLLTTLLRPVYAQEQHWQSQKGILYTANSPAKQARAINSLGLVRGEWLLVAMRFGCGDCDREARRIPDSPRTVILVDGQSEHAKTWQAKYRFKRARVVAVSEQVWDDLGLFWFPTIVKIKDGKIVGASRTML